jgi:phosphorylcholine metabolism protein LicD
MPHITNSEAQSLSAVLRSVLHDQNEAQNASREVMRQAKRLENIFGIKVPKETKNAAWAKIYKEGQKLKRNENLQTMLKRQLGEYLD